ncbi:angiopoietin-1 receptor-like isoform X2 [Hydra vulgaris]|uniref:angiopoietin-1 receptor-like isoform X2 n=1 Tax=Hydra vulgaris TaxID=6087 RepID=UPI001F5E9945|nr:angiopoietin-1 receptor-like isoform X2 [Hydra vulgaris]XP_047133294.1 angiopoietin-1 receptor-like isoform X3 [Hydra vulgaris]
MVQKFKEVLSFTLVIFTLFYIKTTETNLEICKPYFFPRFQQWFIWGRLYSYCMHLKVNNSQPSSLLVDENCYNVPCKECMTVCTLSLPFNLTKCLSICTTTSCKFGCLFYSYITENTRENFQINEQNSPYINSTFQVTPIENNELNITFAWPTIWAINSFIQSIYLITITVVTTSSSNTGVLGLVSENTFNVNEQLVCNNLGPNIFAYDNEIMFQLNIYPINYNGYNESNVISSRLATFANIVITTLSVSGPTYTFNNNSIKLLWNAQWTYPKNLETICKHVEIRRSFQPLSLNLIKLLGNNINDPRVVELRIKSEVISFPNTQDDLLSSCNLFVEVKPRIGQCSVGTATIVPVYYRGCQYVSSYDPNYCIISNTSKPTVPPITKNFTISDLFYMKMFDSNSSLQFYNITVLWIKPLFSVPITQYKIAYGQLSNTLFPFQNYTEKIIASDALSYNITMVTPGILLGVYLYAFTGTAIDSYMPLNVSDYLIIQVPPAPTQSSKSTETISLPLPASGNINISTIIAAILVPLLVILVILVTVVVVMKICRKKIKSQPSIRNQDLCTMEDYIGFDFQADEWEIFPNSIVLDKKIGEGAFGTVYIAKLNADVFAKTKYASRQSKSAFRATNVAVKLLKDGASHSEYSDFREEIDLMKGIGYHKNIVNMIGCSTIKKPLCLLVEFMENGDLLQFLRNRRSKLCSSKIDGEPAISFMYTPGYQQSLETTTSDSFIGLMPNNVSLDEEVITPEDLLSFAWQVASGMEYLSCIKLVHRDLAARNILVGAEKNVKISDFGLTRKVNDELNYMSTKNRRLPVKWMSVEAIFDQMFTSFSDVWAYGVVLFEIVTLGGTPFPTISNRELLNLLKSGYRMERPENCSEPMYSIMLHCWNEDPLQRPTFTELREHLEEILSEGDHYFSFDIDEENTYYNAASFNSLPPESNDDVLEEEIFRKPVQVKFN